MSGEQQQGVGGLKKAPPTPLPPGLGPLPVAVSDSIVPTLANLTLQQQQEMQEMDSSLAIPSTSSSPGPLPALSELGLASVPPLSSADAADERLPAAANVSTRTLDGPSPISPVPTSPGRSQMDACTAAGIKAKDFGAVAAAAAAAAVTGRQADAGMNATMSSGSFVDPASNPAAGSATSSTASIQPPLPSSTPSTSISSPPSMAASAVPTPRTATSSSSSRPGLPPSLSTSSAIRQPGVGGQRAGVATRIPPSLQAKMAAMASRSNNPTSLQFAQNTHIGATERIPTSAFLRQSSNGPPSSSSTPSTSSPQLVGQSGPGRPAPLPGSAVGRVGSAGPMGSLGSRSSPAPSAAGGPIPGLRMPGPGGGIAKRRGPPGGLNLANMATNGADSSTTPVDGDAATNGSTPAAATGGINGRAGRPAMKLPTGSSTGPGTGTPFSNFSKIVDPSGSLNFQNKAVLHAKGVDFSTGASFNINMDELELQDELGSGNYGTVQKVFHKVTKVTMAMKEIRLELDDSKLKGIITELDVLHRATAPEIVEFYGAFFIESCVYYCMEYMDAGSLDKLSVIPVPEPVLQRVTASMVRGLKFLKDALQIMHRDVKPTNVLVNTAGMVKLCDFGVSGQLERSLAKTNIGCQSYMAPERIKGESQNFLGTYTVSSDVWSLGLSIVEFTIGRYPYPPETYSNVFAQLTAIVHGDPPALPDGFSKSADDFVAACLQKDAGKRPSYAQLLRHPFLANEATQDTDMKGWVKAALEKRASMKNPGSSSAGTMPLPAKQT